MMGTRRATQRPIRGLWVAFALLFAVIIYVRTIPVKLVRFTRSADIPFELLQGTVQAERPRRLFGLDAWFGFLGPKAQHAASLLSPGVKLGVVAVGLMIFLLLLAGLLKLLKKLLGEQPASPTPGTYNRKKVVHAIVIHLWVPLLSGAVLGAPLTCIWVCLYVYNKDFRAYLETLKHKETCHASHH